MSDSLALKLQQLSSAEDFFGFFAVPYQPAVVNVSRLHILKRFYQYIRQEANLPDSDELALYQRYRTLLIKAYEDFLSSTPAQEKVFKVFQDVDGQQHVSLQSLKASLPARAAVKST